MLEPEAKRRLSPWSTATCPTRGMMVGVSTGWHAHLDALAGAPEWRRTLEPFWTVGRLKAEYDRRIPA